jgi:mannitol 2-dehydrogenase
MKQALDAQDGLYTLILKHSDGTWEPRVIGSIVQHLFAPDDPEAVIEKMAAASTRIVSLTITEGGYNISDITGEFDAANPDVVRDLEQGAAPRTTFGLVTEALNRRKKRGLDPFTVMSCDNLQGNGHLARAAFATFARQRDPELADWVKREVCFPDSIVDRITPTTTDAAGRSPGAVRHRRPVAGSLRAVHAVGALGRLHGRAGRRTKTPGYSSRTTWSRTDCC